MSTATKKKKLQRVCALWKTTSKDGKKTYFSGKVDDGTFENECYVTGFYNTEKKNLKEPDLRIYARDDEGNLSKEPFLSLWCNATKNGKKILSGKLNGKRVIGFIKADATEKQPYISIYYSDEETESDKTDTKSEEKTTKKEEPKFEEIPSDGSLPF